jgi:4-amino-4-deoxy-L-arabinose transferase-like glycosyltransferase
MMTENTKSKIQNTKSKSQITWLLFALVIVFIYFFGLTVPLLGPDEPRYSQVAREMFERGDWTTPTLGGFDWFEKPALLYWLQIASYILFGVSEFAARFGSALFGLGTIFCLWLLGKTVQDSEFKIQDSSKIQKHPGDFANYLALIAASSIGLIAFSRGASFDIILTFPITASLVGFFVYENFPQRGKDAKESEETKQKESTNVRKGFLNDFSSSPLCAFAGLFAFYFFIGVALVAKGLVGIVFPFAIVAFYHVLSWKLPSKTFVLSLVWGTFTSLIVASAWYLPMYQANGWKFIDEFFIQHHFQRYASNKYQHPQPFWFFWIVLPLMTVPWLPFFFAAIWNFVKEFFQPGDAETQKINGKTFSRRFFFLPLSSSPLLVFAIAWLLVPLVFFSLSGSKLPGYVLPALPGSLILTADYVYRFAQKSEKRRVFVKALAATMLLVIAIIIQFILMSYASHETVKNLVETANANGYEREKIVNLYTVSHNLEFYAANRLVREADGKQKRFDNFSVLVNSAKNEPNNQILVLVPEKDVSNLLNENTIAETKVLDRNGEHAMVVVKAK